LSQKHRRNYTREEAKKKNRRELFLFPTKKIPAASRINRSTTTAQFFLKKNKHLKITNSTKKKKIHKSTSKLTYAVITNIIIKYYINIIN